MPLNIMIILRLIFIFIFGTPLYLSAQSNQLDNLPQPIIEFIGSVERPDFGTYNSSAPIETLQFGRFSGLWSVETHAYSNGEWYSGWPAIWAFKYILDGFAVQDLWFTDKSNLSPPIAHLERDYFGTNIRVFDPQSGRWMITWCTNQGDQLQSSPCRSFYATQKHQVIEMQPYEQTGKQHSRVLFQNATDTTFTWVREISDDQGTTWQPRLRLEAKRMK